MALTSYQGFISVWDGKGVAISQAVVIPPLPRAFGLGLLRYCVVFSNTDHTYNYCNNSGPPPPPLSLSLSLSLSFLPFFFAPFLPFFGGRGGCWMLWRAAFPPTPLDEILLVHLCTCIPVKTLISVGYWLTVPGPLFMITLIIKCQ